jgi:FdhE protein
LHKGRQQELNEEIKTCCRLYPEFAGAEPLVRSLYKAREPFTQKTSLPDPINLSAEEILHRLNAGSPLIDKPVVDKKAFLELFQALSPQFVKKEPSLKDALKELETYFKDYFALQEGETWSVSEWPDLIAGAVEKTPVQRDLATLIVTFILSSLFDLHYNLEQADGIDTDAWKRGSCPVCGTRPHYGLLKDKEGVRMLACWLCGFRWGFPRLKCPSCLNTDMEDLGLFTVEDNQSCRVHFCKKCRSYLKVFDLRDAVAEDTHLPVHNLATLSYDLHAAKEGFKAGSGLQWVNEEEQNQSAN